MCARVLAVLAQGNSDGIIVIGVLVLGILKLLHLLPLFYQHIGQRVSETVRGQRCERRIRTAALQQLLTADDQFPSRRS
jgi:hypothetical protein